jgi:hypothetical protein
LEASVFEALLDVDKIGDLIEILEWRMRYQQLINVILEWLARRSRVSNESRASRYPLDKTFHFLNRLVRASDVLTFGVNISSQSLHPLEEHPLQGHFFNGTCHGHDGIEKLVSILEMLSLKSVFEITE